METAWTATDSALLDDLLTLLEDDDDDGAASAGGTDPRPLYACTTPTLATVYSYDTNFITDTTITTSSSNTSNVSCSNADTSGSLALQRRRSNGKGGCPVKRTIDNLRDEAEQLSEELQRLQHVTCSMRGTSMETAQSERFKRRRAELECQQLRDAVYAQTLFIRGLKSVFSMPPSFATGLDLCHHLHYYTRLPSDRSTRWNEYAALAQETRVKNAMDILTRETESLSVSDAHVPHIQTELLPGLDSFSITATSVYAVESNDLSAVLRGVCVAVSDIVATCLFYKCTKQKRRIVDPDSAVSGSNILYRLLDTHHKSRQDSDELSIQSRIVTLYKQTDDYAVVLWDYVDDDELHPEDEAVDVTRQAIGACLIRRERCGDGRTRAVVRAINTRRYRYRTRAPKDVMQRFLSVSAQEMHPHELLFRGIVVDQVAKEEAVYAQTLQALDGSKIL